MYRHLSNSNIKYTHSPGVGLGSSRPKYLSSFFAAWYIRRSNSKYMRLIGPLVTEYNHWSTYIATVCLCCPGMPPHCFASLFPTPDRAHREEYPSRLQPRPHEDFSAEHSKGAFWQRYLLLPEISVKPGHLNKRHGDTISIKLQQILKLSNWAVLLPGMPGLVQFLTQIDPETGPSYGDQIVTKLLGFQMSSVYVSFNILHTLCCSTVPSQYSMLNHPAPIPITKEPPRPKGMISGLCVSLHMCEIHIGYPVISGGLFNVL